MKYYAYKNGMKYRLTVTGETSWMCGNFFHAVKIESRLNLHRINGQEVRAPYVYEGKERIHGCEDAKEAAYYVAGKLGLQIA